MLWIIITLVVTMAVLLLLDGIDSAHECISGNRLASLIIRVIVLAISLIAILERYAS